MSRLAVWAVVFGVLKLGGSIFAALRPELFRKGVVAFPRSVWPARILTVIDLVWAAFLLNAMAMGNFDRFKVALYGLCPLAIILVVIYLDELLAPRALGGLYLLLAAPLLDVARCHPSSWSLLMTVVAYMMVIAGIAFILTPYLFRKMFSFWIRDDRICRSMAMIGIFAGAVMLGIGLFVY
jgi:uncharacterized protein YjeT (DUF2065 family)